MQLRSARRGRPAAGVALLALLLAVPCAWATTDGSDGGAAPAVEAAPAPAVEPAPLPAVEPIPAPAAEPAPGPAATGPTYTVLDRYRRLAEKGMHAGSPIMIRIFKAESELELWIERDGRLELFNAYPICFWSGKLGPKLREGDRQAPEGLYAVSAAQLHLKGRHPRSLDLGFPNVLDRALARTGSYILVHGGCKSIGCFAMTDPIMEEIFALTRQAIAQGQGQVQVHVFPFRLSDENLAGRNDHPWYRFWLNLKDAYDAFERTRSAPRVGVCGGRYVVREALPSLGNGDTPDAYLPTTADACEHAPVEDLAPLRVAEAEAALQARQVRRAAFTPLYHRHRVAAGRNARKAYAAARRARMAAYARRASR